MQMILWTFLIVIIIVLLNLMLTQLRKQSVTELDKTLYVNQNPQLYLQLLDNKRLKLLFPDSAIQLMKLNAYLMIGDGAKIEEQMNLIDQLKLAKGDKVDYQTRKLSYFCEIGNKEQALSARNQISALIGSSRNQKDHEIAEDANRIYRIYIEHDASLIKPLKQMMESQSGTQKAITAFRIAKLYHQQGDDDSAQKYLEKGYGPSLGSAYRSIISECINDTEKLECH